MKVLCGYNVNIDAVQRIDTDELVGMLAHHDATAILESMQAPPDVIDSMEDFLAGLVLCMKDGSGAEWFIHNEEVFHDLRSRFFERARIRMGGNMGIMANVLSQIGASQVVPNVVSPSRAQIALFYGGSIFVPGYGGVHAEPSSIGNVGDRDGGDEPIHFVFDFKKGDTFLFNGSQLTVPRENRFIATYDQANPELAIAEDFETYALEHIWEMDGALVSGFHMLQEQYPDGSGYGNKLGRVLEQLREWKHLNPDMMIHAELGHFSTAKIAETVFSGLSDNVDSIGMNEDELSVLADMYDCDTPGIKRMNAMDIVRAAIGCTLRSYLTKMIVHTREFIVSVCRGDQWDPAGEIEGMEFGIKCAAVFAATGKLESRDKVEQTTASLTESDAGRAQVKQVARSICGSEYGRGVAGYVDDRLVCIVPTLICDDPISTVGLGDTVSSATFLRQLEIYRGTKD
ncbi:MAG: ADP-dependent glucokinase/phosphofructokinase [Euryarchaeota archaeon]|nr:ADP-dependent glucokinase/phosphofructokinase [Euryarchaeota archaeon]